MCGILGGNKEYWNYQSAIDLLYHRGPDGNRVKRVSDNLTMAFSRLSIVDLSDSGMQPMSDSSGNITITFNGELYDYLNLRNILEQKGYRFVSDSDTEVLLNAYCEWGDEFTEYIDGMFAIAVYDKRTEMVKLFRDRAGIKPLYWFFDGSRFAYASELKSIIQLVDDYHFEIDNTSMLDYFTYLYIPDPKTVYKNVFKLEAAHLLTFDLLNCKIVNNSAYWELKINSMEGDKGPDDADIDLLRKLIRKNVEKQLIADVKVGGFLSGGIDSSILAFEALKVDPTFKTFSLGFYDFETNELPYVECLEKHIDFQAKKQLIKNEDISSLYYNVEKWFDEPFSDTSAYPTYLVSQLAKSECTVALSGDGGDEIFGGYSRYEGYLSLLNKDNTTFEDEIKYLWDIHTYNPSFNKKEIYHLLNIPNDYDDCWLYKKYYIKDLPPITRLQYMDFMTYLPGDILVKTDRVGMAVSLETRVPFLSRDIIEFAFSLTQEKRTPNGELKGILKKAYKDDLPRNLLYRKKWGFGIPTSFLGYDVNPQTKLYKDIYSRNIRDEKKL